MANALIPTAINPCFAAGTRILTERGEVPVEDLVIGDAVVLSEGDTAPVTWIGIRDIDFSRHPTPRAARPIRLQAGALSTGVPERELCISPDHALFFDGSLVQAKDLVDGIVIRQDMEIAAIRSVHVALSHHAILLAEGAAAESYLDTGHGAVFTFSEPPVSLHPNPRALRRSLGVAAPLVTGGKTLATIRSRLHARKLMLGLRLVDDPALHLTIGDMMLTPVFASGWAVFTIPSGRTAARLVSPVFVPAEVDPASHDRRSLGVAISDLMVNDRFAPLDSCFHPADLHPASPRDTEIWTRGNARLALPPGTTTLSVKIAASPKRWNATGSFR
jgi:hypothetical protein